MKNSKFTMAISTVLCLIPVVIGVALYDKVPDRVAVHFNASNIPDSYASKNFAIFGIPGILAVLNIILRVINNNEPKKKHISKGMSNFLMWSIPILSFFANSTIILFSVGIILNIGVIVSSIVGMFFIIIGNYLPKTKQNSTVGIKLPWTLNSEENWNRVHHLAGYLWMVGGLIMIVCGFLENKGFIILTVTTTIMVIIPFIYSLYLYKKGI